MSYGRAITVGLPFDETVALVRRALGEQGFGVLTEIDLAATMREKLGAEVEPYLILGACNPPLAHRALEADRSVGLLLPCNVVVRTVPEGVRVEALDPRAMMSLAGEPALEPVADEAARRLDAALDAVAAAGQAA